MIGRVLATAVICAPFISAALLAIHRTGRALTRYARNHRST